MGLDARTRAAHFTHFCRGIRKTCIQAGFKPQRDRSFSKEINDVIWSIGPYRIPVYDCDGTSIQLEFGILSPKLVVLTSPDWTELSFLRSQIRVSYSDFVKKGVGESGVFCISTESDLAEAIQMANEIITAHGLPFLSRVDSTERILEAYFQHEFARYSVRSDSRSRYERLAWISEIDPQQISFMEWQKTQPDALPETLVQTFNLLASSEEHALSLKRGIEDMGYKFSCREIQVGWLCSARRLTESYNPTKKERDAISRFADASGAEFWSSTVGHEKIEEDPQ
ncbi:MAG: hypothetical protein M3R13_06675 [Armatimonadota bacterium]|nr:hypothetical protein [Armatimonadota bacterium]